MKTFDYSNAAFLENDDKSIACRVKIYRSFQQDILAAQSVPTSNFRLKMTVQIVTAIVLNSSILIAIYIYTIQ